MDRIIAQSEEEFRRGVTSLRANDLAAIMNLIQREMRQEQDEFNRLSERLTSLDENSKDYAYLEKARIQSQTRLSSLMNKSMICLDQEAAEPQAKPTSVRPTPKAKAPPPPQPSREARPGAYAPASSFGSATLASSVSVTRDAAPARDPRQQRQQQQPARETVVERLVTRRVTSHPPADQSAPRQDNGVQSGAEEKGEAVEESETRAVNARSLIANFERMSCVSPGNGDGPGSRPPPRRSASAFMLNTSAGSINNCNSTPPPVSQNGPLPHSASMSQLRKVPAAQTSGDRTDGGPTRARHSQPPPPPPLGAKEVEIVAKKEKTVAKAPEVVAREAAPVARDPEQRRSAVGTTNGGVVIGDEKVQPPPSLRLWDPSKLLRLMFVVRLVPEENEPTAGVTCRGVMDRLPDQKKKNTMLKTWKRRFFVAEAGQMRTFEVAASKDKAATANQSPLSVFNLSGGRVEDLGDMMIGIDDGCGRFVTVRCLTREDHSRWLRSLQSQAGHEQRLDYVVPRPLAATGRHPSRRVLIVDIGSFALRAGVLGDAPALPSLFFPCIAAVGEGEPVIGADAFRPQVRSGRALVQPVRPETTIENVAFDKGILRAMFEYIFKQLNVQPQQYTVLLSVPHTTNETTRARLVELLLDKFNCQAVSMCGQAMLALYAYGLTTGVVVDLGNRMEIMPVTDGVVQRGGVSRQPYGGSRIAATMNLHLSERGCRFHSETETLLTQHCVQQASYVCNDPDIECDVTNDHETVLDLSKFDLPPDYISSVSLLAAGRCRSAEGLFSPADYFGMDTPSMPRLVQRAIAACPMDLRRDLARRVILSGGASLLPGLVPRLEKELGKLLPALSVVRVHAAPNRLHAAFLGACRLAALPEFEAQCLSRQEWRQAGAKAIRNRWAV